jgi:hypothetical protein
LGYRSASLEHFEPEKMRKNGQNIDDSLNLDSNLSRRLDIPGLKSNICIILLVVQSSKLPPILRIINLKKNPY